MLSTAVHLALWFAIVRAPPHVSLDRVPWYQRQEIEVVLLAPAVPATQLAPPPVRTAGRRSEKAAPLLATPKVRAVPVVAPEPFKTPEVDEFGLARASSAPVSAAEIMRLAKQDIANIIGELNKDIPERDKALSSDLQKRLDQRFEEAHASARPHWYQAARIEEITAAGSSGARVYRITTSVGTFCMTYPKGGARPTYGTCP